MTTISYSNPRYHSTVGTDQKTPEDMKLKAAVQTAVTALDLRDTTLQSSFVQRIPLTLTANGTWAGYTSFPTACTVTGISVVTPTVFASTGGTVLLSVLKSSSSGNTMLGAATYDLEVPLADARTALTLTATAADLGIAANGLVYFKIVSNNADATGPNAGGAALLITYTPTIV